MDAAHPATPSGRATSTFPRPVPSHPQPNACDAIAFDTIACGLPAAGRLRPRRVAQAAVDLACALPPHDAVIVFDAGLSARSQVAISRSSAPTRRLDLLVVQPRGHPVGVGLEGWPHHGSRPDYQRDAWRSMIPVWVSFWPVISGISPRRRARTLTPSGIMVYLSLRRTVSARRGRPRPRFAVGCEEEPSSSARHGRRMAAMVAGPSHVAGPQPEPRGRAEGTPARQHADPKPTRGVAPVDGGMMDAKMFIDREPGCG